MTSSILFRSMALLMGGIQYAMPRNGGALPITLSLATTRATKTRNGNKPSGAARLKRSAIKLGMAKARASKRFI